MKLSQRTQGSALMTVAIFSAGLVIVIGALIAMTLQSYRLSKRNEARSIARAVAESELEAIYFEFKYALATNKNVDVVPSYIAGGFLDYTDSTGSTASTDPTKLGQPLTIRQPYLEKYRSPSDPQQAWTVKRSLTYNSGDHVDGTIGSSNQAGHNYYMTAEVEVIPPPSYAAMGATSFRIGRQLVYSVYTVLQYGLFYQGDLEMTPGTSFDVKGDISVNGSIYMGAANSTDPSNPAVALNIFGKVNLTGYFNKDVSGATTYFEPDPYYQKPLVNTTILPPDFKPGAQLVKETAPTNFLGGVAPSTVEANNPTLFPDDNSVYRSLITPPPKLFAPDGTLTSPNTAGYGSNPPDDDPTISKVRLYNMASLIITIDSGSVSVQEIDAASGKIMSQPYSSDYTNAVAPNTVTMYDQREGKNVSVTDIDIGGLAKLAGDPNFQGVVYVNQIENPASPSAIRLVNGASTPQKVDATSSDAAGFTIATNGGMYVKGDYNSATSTNPTILLADSVTALSSNWNDANSNLPVDSRKATTDVTINAAIMTGNTPTTLKDAAAPATSGGAQNLVRFLEDWTGRTVTLNGSLGRLFDSKYFTGAYSGLNYHTPTRNIIFDTNLAKTTPKGAPSVKSYSRGAYFEF